VRRREDALADTLDAERLVTEDEPRQRRLGVEVNE